MSKFAVEIDEDAEVIYQGHCKIGLYSRTNTGVQSFTLKDFDNNDQFLNIMHNVPANTPVKLIGGVGTDLYFNNWDLMLKKAGDGIRTGPHIDLRFPELDDYSFDTIKSLKESNEDIHATIIKGEILIKKRPAKGPHGDFALKLMRSRLIMMTEFWRMVGSEDQYEKWLRTQPCCVTGKFHKDEVTGEKLCEVAHVRDINWGAGVAKKPPYYAIPLIHKVHHDQHIKTMAYVWNRYVGRKMPPNSALHFPITCELEIVKSWFAYQAQAHVKRWIKETIKKQFNVPSLSFVSEKMFREYLTSISAHDMIRFL